MPEWTPATLRVGESYTVQGAISLLRSRHPREEIKGKQITIEGVIVRSNFADAPACVVHRTGLRDPEGCTSAVPAFWIADTPDSASAIKVMGFASNFPQVYDAIVHERSGASCAEPIQDEYLGTALPCPMAAARARVRVTGSYDFSYRLTASGMETEPLHGILTFARMETLTPAPVRATLPGMGP